MARRGSHAVVCLPDAHFPEHDPEAMAVALAAIRRIKPRRVVILGDWLEASAFSRHPRNKINEAAADFETGPGREARSERRRGAPGRLRSHQSKAEDLRRSEGLYVDPLLRRGGPAVRDRAGPLGYPRVEYSQERGGETCAGDERA
jgi:hypothetical protein